jgi:phenylacetate-CoA ligase
MGDIACERPGSDGLWVAPWGNYVEIVDSEGNRVPDGTEGEILVTSLANFAMPFIRYRIGDLGVLSPVRRSDQATSGQILTEVLGRTLDVFKAKNGDRIHGGYFLVMLFYRDWIAKYQVIQRSDSCILFRIVRSGADCDHAELDEIAARTRLVMGDDCEVAFEFVDEIAPCDSGKYRYVTSEVSRW